jgi:TFIIF-interacting CTD phosphatase-like protein
LKIKRQFFCSQTLNETHLSYNLFSLFLFYIIITSLYNSISNNCSHYSSKKSHIYQEIDVSTSKERNKIKSDKEELFCSFMISNLFNSTLPKEKEVLHIYLSFNQISFSTQHDIKFIIRENGKRQPAIGGNSSSTQSFLPFSPHPTLILKTPKYLISSLGECSRLWEDNFLFLVKV